MGKGLAREEIILQHKNLHRSECQNASFHRSSCLNLEVYKLCLPLKPLPLLSHHHWSISPGPVQGHQEEMLLYLTEKHKVAMLSL